MHVVVQEIKFLAKYMFVNALMRLMWTVVPSMVGVASFAVYAGAGKELTATKARASFFWFGLVWFGLVWFGLVFFWFFCVDILSLVNCNSRIYE